MPTSQQAATFPDTEQLPGQVVGPRVWGNVEHHGATRLISSGHGWQAHVLPREEGHSVDAAVRSTRRPITAAGNNATVHSNPIIAALIAAAQCLRSEVKDGEHKLLVDASTDVRKHLQRATRRKSSQPGAGSSWREQRRIISPKTWESVPVPVLVPEPTPITPPVPALLSVQFAR